MDYTKAKALLQSIDELHLLDGWEMLSDEKQQALLLDIALLDLQELKNQKSLLEKSNAIPQHQAISPFTDYALSGNDSNFTRGKKLIAEGKVGCLLIAGGQGTRLGIKGPKGTYPVTCIQHKSLFQLAAEKVVAAGIQANRELPLAIMTSKENHEETVQFFLNHDNFGLKKEQLSFFSQKSLPFLDKSGHLFFETPSKIAKGPAGNGNALIDFYQEGPGAAWQAQGIAYINFILVDNPLADPFDAELVGYLSKQGSDITIKCTIKTDPQESVGILGYIDKKACVIEYTEMPAKLKTLENEDGTLLYKCANLSLFCFSTTFIQAIAQDKTLSLPLHKVLKPANCLGEKIQAWKYEKYIFDLLSRGKVSALLYPRESCFAPVKNLNGNDSPITAAKMIEECDRQQMEKITGQKIDLKEGRLEIHPQFYYPIPALLNQWKGRIVQGGGYLEM